MQIGEEDIENLFLAMRKPMKIHQFLFIFHHSLSGNQINIFQFEAIMQKEDLWNLKLLYLNYSFEE